MNHRATNQLKYGEPTASETAGIDSSGTDSSGTDCAESDCAGTESTGTRGTGTGATESAAIGSNSIGSSSIGVRRVWFAIARLPAQLLIGLVRFYQLAISPWFGHQCRYTPTCSRYMIEAIQKYGAVRGLFKGVCRILRCHPFRSGGFDPP